MSASKYIKAQGLPSLKYVADTANIDRQKLTRWYGANFALFSIVVFGVKEIQRGISALNEEREDEQA